MPWHINLLLKPFKTLVMKIFMNVDSKFIRIANNSVLYNLQNIQKNIQSDSKETVSYRKARHVHIATCKFCFVNIVKLGSRSKVYLKFLRHLNLELDSIIAMSPPPPPHIKLFWAALHWNLLLYELISHLRPFRRR